MPIALGDLFKSLEQVAQKLISALTVISVFGGTEEGA
jgi:hypothetical protein